MASAFDHLTGAFVVICLFLQSQAAGAVIDTDIVLGPDHPYPAETIVVVDGIGGPTQVTVVEGARIGGLPLDPAVPTAFEVFGRSSVTMLDGFVKARDQAVYLHEQSSFAMFGGEIGSGAIEAHDSSSVFIEGGRWHAAFSYDSSRLRIGGPRDESDSLIRTFGQSHAVFEEGIDEFSLEAKESSTVVVRGGEFHLINATGNSRILVNGGFFTDTSPSAFGNGVVDIWSVGSIGEERIAAVGNGIVNIYGFGLRFDVEVDLDQTRDVIVGKLADGDGFRAEYRIIDQGQIILHEVPEPGTLGLLAAGAGTIVAASRWSRHLAGAWGSWGG